MNNRQNKLKKLWIEWEDTIKALIGISSCFGAAFIFSKVGGIPIWLSFLIAFLIIVIIGILTLCHVPGFVRTE